MPLYHRTRLKLTDLAADTNHGVIQIESPATRAISYKISMEERGVAPTDKHTCWEIRRGFTGEASNRTEQTTATIGVKETVDLLDTTTPAAKIYTWASGSRPTVPSDGDLVNAGMFHPQARRECSGNLNPSEKHSLFLESDTINIEKWLIIDIWEG